MLKQVEKLKKEVKRRVGEFWMSIHSELHIPAIKISSNVSVTNKLLLVDVIDEEGNERYWYGTGFEQEYIVIEKLQDELNKYILKEFDKPIKLYWALYLSPIIIQRPNFHELAELMKDSEAE